MKRDGALLPLLGSAGIYGLTNVLQRAIPVLLLPVLARYLSAAELGMVALFVAAANVATPLVGLNASYAVQRRFFDLDSGALARYLAACLLLVGVGTGVSAAIVLAAAQPLTALSGLPSGWLLMAVAYAASQVLVLLPLTLWQAERRAARYGAVQVARTAVQAIATLVLVIGFGLGWRGATGGMLVAGAFSVLFVALPHARRWVAAGLERRHVEHAARYGGALIPHTLGALVITSADRFFLNTFTGAAETGVYFAGYQIGSAVVLVADAFTRAWSPWLYARLETPDPREERRIVRYVYLACGGLLLLAGLVTAAAPPLIAWVLPAEYARSEVVVGWVALGFAFNGMYRVISGFIFHAERTLTLSWITAFAAIVNVLANVIFIPRWGATGAAMASALAFASSLVLTFIAAVRVRPLPWLAFGRD